MVPAIADRLPLYPVALAVVSALFLVAERLRPARPQQGFWRKGIVGDLAFLVFNAHFLGVGLYWLAVTYVIPPLDRALVGAHLQRVTHLGIASTWPLWLQIGVAVVATDLIQWLVHRMLHRVPLLWRFHQVHHSVVDGQMDFLVSFRFHWAEAVAYKTVQFLPLAFFGFSTAAMFAQAVVGTIAGHFNHSNLDIGRGPLRYVFSTPRMHLWHHTYALPVGHVRNYGVVFSAWDWLFGTAYFPEQPPEHLGFPGAERLPRGFVGKELWPAVKA